ncbi:MAG: rhodanese-like domain-containing protein [Capsulimonadales bacterium]|nr:rhodanese-like domain-containing protein [Capsulimonadales bacterium]
MGFGFSVRIAIECNLNEAIEANEDDSLNYAVLTPQEVLLRSSRPDVLLLDVRTPREYVCHRIPGSQLMPVQELSGGFERLDPRHPTICVCEHGIRSETAAAFLAAQGFREVYTMRGGIVQWPGPLLRGPFTDEFTPCEEK